MKKDGYIDGYLPIEDYGIIGDGRSTALVSRTGSIDWWCLPRVDGDPIFGRILDADKGGYFSVQPIGPFESRRHYLEGTNMLVTEFSTSDGVFKVVDFMPALKEAQKRVFPVPHRGIIRRIEGVSGRVPYEVVVRARPHYGLTTPLLQRHRADRYRIEWDDQALFLICTIPFECKEGALEARGVLAAGDKIDLALAYSHEAPADIPVLSALDQIQQLSESFWRDWSSICKYHGPYRDAVLRSALSLKLQTYAPSGAIVAAPTTSLPEEIGGERNWDYRYCWLRDAAFTVRALLSLGYEAEAHAFVGWMLHTTRLTHPRLQVLYSIYGEAHIPERIISHLEGYCRSGPVRVGNAASDQFQLDIYGEVIDAFALYRRNGGQLDRDARKLVNGMAEFIMSHWREPDDGIWEVRSGRAQHVHSKVMAWVGLQRVLELAEKDGLKVSVERVARVRDAIHAWVLDCGYDPTLRSFTRTPGHDLDAAQLVIPLVGFLDPGDYRLAGTVEAIQRHLGTGELISRYAGPDGLPGKDGAFLICSFWMVEALAHVGRIDQAHEHFRRLLERRNDLGLLAEEIDPETGRMLGNFPQAFSDIGLINAALTLAELEGQVETAEHSSDAAVKRP